MDPDRQIITSEDAIRRWAAEAHAVLLDVASHYNKVITPATLTTRVQDRTGVRTDAPASEWYPRLLQQVIHRCHATGEPPLTSLVIGRDGGVGVAYAEALRLQGLGAANPLAREKHAAAARLDCYLRYAPDVPDGAVPQLSAEVRRAATAPSGTRGSGPSRTPRAPRTPQPAAPDRPLNRVCPRCFLETPLDGECQNCL